MKVKKPPPCQHGGDMLSQGDGKTPNTSKGEGRCRTFNILLNVFGDIKQSLEIGFYLSEFIPRRSHDFLLPSSKSRIHSATSLSDNLRSLAAFGAECRACFNVFAKVSDEMISACVPRASA